LLLGGWALALGLDKWAEHDTPWILFTSMLGSFIAYIYSAPPLKLKAIGWQVWLAIGWQVHDVRWSWFWVVAGMADDGFY
jgi:chlorophyll synthase